MPLRAIFFWASSEQTSLDHQLEHLCTLGWNFMPRSVRRSVSQAANDFLPAGQIVANIRNLKYQEMFNRRQPAGLCRSRW
jgi:hypothetical protein